MTLPPSLLRLSITRSLSCWHAGQSTTDGSVGEPAANTSTKHGSIAQRPGISERVLPSQQSCVGLIGLFVAHYRVRALHSS
jgi:hypothetical protein